jgi:heme oxygenase
MITTVESSARALASAGPALGIDVLAALRAATSGRHEVLDRSMPLSRERPGPADLAAHLALLLAWLAPLEGWLAGFADGPQGPEAPLFLRRVPALEADLADLADFGAEPAPAPAPDAVPPADDRAAWRWGVSYVIEGSQLGGTVLYRQLAGPLAPHPLRYLRGEEEGIGARWQGFVRALCEGVRTPAEIALASAGARDAFDRLLGLLDPSFVPAGDPAP